MFIFLRVKKHLFNSLLLTNFLTNFKFHRLFHFGCLFLNQWTDRRRRDEYRKRAKIEGYRSRAAYKLAQIDSKFKLIRKGETVVDLCAAPGGWSQYASIKVGEKGRVIAVDKMKIKPIEDVANICGDITAFEEILKTIEEVLKDEKADVVLSDCSPSVSGKWSLDHARQIFLAEASRTLVTKILKRGGNFVVKVFQGDLLEEYVTKIKRGFSFVKRLKPKASRKKSAEIYIIAKDFR